MPKLNGAQQVPLLNNEFEFIAITTPEVVADVDETPSQRERVTESLIRCPARSRRLSQRRSRACRAARR